MSFTIPAELQLRLGTYPNDGTGDDLNTAFKKIQATFTLLNSELSQVGGAATVNSTGSAVYAGNTNGVLQFKNITGSGGIVVTAPTSGPDANTINITNSALTSIQSDTTPTLGGNLNLNGHNIVGNGDIQTNVWGIDVRNLQALINTTTGGDVDFGSFTQPATVDFDFGSF
jgi:hypothetical protein